jgi:uncharacterized protein (TIGR02453 family)
MNLDNSVLEFLKKLEKNNNREWFAKHKSMYDNALEHYTVFIDEVATCLKKSDMIEDVKRFRIYRDIRFSKDKTPYKNNFGTGFSRATARLRGGYYLHIQNDGCFAGGGFWSPEPQDIKRIRDEFSYDSETIMKIQKEKNFKKYFGSIKGDALVNAPRGYDPLLPAIDLIKKKQWIVMRAFDTKDLTSKNFSTEVVKTFEALRPFFDYMSDVLNTDSNGEPIN